RPNHLRPNHLRPNHLRPNHLRPNHLRPNHLRQNRRRPNRQRLNRRHPNRLRLNRRHPNRLRRDRLQAVLQPSAVKQNSEKVHRADRTKRAGRAQHCQLQFPWQEVTMISRHDRTKTLVALAMWLG
ncbi:hypothetical protein, partial [Paraburkholderia madseniana]|uniref:hypothetical protein n=1 Tax=Paraburkholderia madseniana TaxID=2599607 RepID=UPI001C12ED1B